jgi:hypothetical protein
MTDFSQPRYATSEAAPPPSAHEIQARLDMQRSQSLNARARLLGSGSAQDVSNVEAESAQKIVPIRMKSVEDAADLGIPGGGVSSINIRVAERREQKRAQARRNAELSGEPVPEENIGNSFKVEKKDGKYFATSSESGESVPAHGFYRFVTFLDGTIRLGAAAGGNNVHSTLSGASLFVRYAGEARFEHGELIWFSNESGTYLPSNELYGQAGFDNDKFVPVK